MKRMPSCRKPKKTAAVEQQQVGQTVGRIVVEQEETQGAMGFGAAALRDEGIETPAGDPPNERQRFEAQENELPGSGWVSQGTRVQVWWSGDKTWYAGEVGKKVVGKPGETDKWWVCYDDGDLFLEDMEAGGCRLERGGGGEVALTEWLADGHNWWTYLPVPQPPLHHRPRCQRLPPMRPWLPPAAMC